MHNTRRQGRIFLALASCAAASLGTAQATVSTAGAAGADGPFHEAHQEAHATLAANATYLPRVAARNKAATYYQAYRLIGSHVLNLDGKRIGEVSSVVIDDHGDLRQVMIALADTRDLDGGTIAVSPYRAQIVSTSGALVTVIRVDLSREELVQAQLVRLKSDARAPEQRGAGTPDAHRDYGPLY